VKVEQKYGAMKELYELLLFDVPFTSLASLACTGWVLSNSKLITTYLERALRDTDSILAV